MVLDGKCVFSNKTMQEMLGYSDAEFTTLDIHDILSEQGDRQDSGSQYFRRFMVGDDVPGQFEARLRHKDGTSLDVVLAMSRIAFGRKDGCIIVAKDISQHKQVQEELGLQRQQYAQLTNAINIGVFRAEAGRSGKLIEANPAVRSILGIEDAADLGAVNLFECFHDADDRQGVIDALANKQQIKDKVVQLQKADGSMPAVLLSLVAVKDDAGVTRYYDGIIEDITEQKRTEEERTNLIAELQSSLLFLNEPISPFLRDTVFCDMKVTAAQAAVMMTKQNFSAILVRSDDNETLGILTDRDLRERIVGLGGDMNAPVFTIMSSPLMTISDSALIFEAILLMQEHGIQHLAVKDHTGKVVGMVRNRDLLQLHRYSATFMFREIHAAGSVEQMKAIHQRVPQLVRSLIESGAKAKNITRIITAVSDGIVERYIRFAIDELGEPPVPFAFAALGSQGRQEQTLVTDQDNTIIYDHVPESQESEVNAYFIALAKKVCTALNDTGYPYCKGEVMAMNPKWCMSLEQWKEQFRQWVEESAPQDLREFNIFFDFRSVYGDKNLTVQLRESVYELLKNNAPFFMHFALDALHYKPPIGMFGKLVLESSGDSADTFDIKEAMLPIVNFARLYALHHGVYETNTLERLHKLYEKNVLKKSDYEETVLSYNYLMQVRFKHQAQVSADHGTADNHINPKELAHINEATLKQTFYQIAAIQKRISLDFTGTA